MDISKKSLNIMYTFLYIINQIKVYHWQTMSFARHKATDELYEELNDLIDKFIEVLMGRIILEKKKTFRISSNCDNLKLIDLKDSEGLNLLSIIKNILENDEDLMLIIKNNTELANIRDEMLAVVNKNGYLFTLS